MVIFLPTEIQIVVFLTTENQKKDKQMLAKDEETKKQLTEKDKQVEQMSKDMLAKDEENEEMRQELARLRALVAAPAEGVPEV